MAVVAHEYPAVEDQGRPTGLLSGQIGHLVFPEENSGPHIQRENHTIGRVADQLIRIGLYKRIVVVGCDCMRTLVDYTDRGVSILFG
ncbi:MAG: hypothetical protein MK239_05385, partial [Gemmatimonadetes bacterium]|nr:hypothetical protein [Gemmatimonadota bacterium]